MSTEDSDVTIGPGKLLGLFFMLVVICGVFFAIGYSLGKTSAHEQALNDKSPLSASLSAPAVGDSSAAKPSAAVNTKNEQPSSSDTEQDGEQEEPDLTFFDAVKGDPKAAGAHDAAAAAAKPGQKKETGQVTVASSAPPAPVMPVAQASPTTKTTTSAEVKPPMSGSFVVQIAAVTREEDAAALAGALRKKNFSVFVVNNPAVHDKFYHVQVGPFASLQDADAMKAKLMGEGYNPS